MLATTIEVIDLPADDRRGATRADVRQASMLRDTSRAPIAIEVLDISRTGMAFRCDQPLPPQAEISVGLNGASRARARVVRSDGDVHGCMFDPALSPEQLGRAFASETVVPFRVAEVDDLADTVDDRDDPADRWPGSVRIAVIALSALSAWALVRWIGGLLFTALRG